MFAASYDAGIEFAAIVKIAPIAEFFAVSMLVGNFEICKYGTEYNILYSLAF